MESSNSMPPGMDSPGEDIILMETVKSMVSHEGRNEAEGTEEDFFLISQDQAVQYPEGNIEETMSHRHQTEVTLTWMHLCRICANTSDRMIPIFEGEGAQHDLISKILKYLPIHVTESDTLPLQLCERCANFLIAWHELNEGCLNAERKLLEMQDSHLRNKQEYYNPSLDNLEVTAPMFGTTASTIIASNITSNITTNIASNITDPLPSQQDDDKSGGCSIEKINKSDRHVVFCPYCYKAHSNHWRLRLHWRMHEPFECELCYNTFKTLSNLRDHHLSLHHEVPFDLPYHPPQRTPMQREE